VTVIYRALTDKIVALEEEISDLTVDIMALEESARHEFEDMQILITALIRISDGEADPMGIAANALGDMTCAGTARRRGELL